MRARRSELLTKKRWGSTTDAHWCILGEEEEEAFSAAKWPSPREKSDANKYILKYGVVLYFNLQKHFSRPFFARIPTPISRKQNVDRSEPHHRVALVFF